MNRKPVKSSTIKTIGYDEKSRTLSVEFHNGGIYEYYNMMSEVYKEFIKAPSIGKYLWKNIRSKYAFKKVL